MDTGSRYENNGVHFLMNGIELIHNELHIFIRKFWQKTERFKSPINIYWTKRTEKAL